jgi:hypothetical protein
VIKFFAFIKEHPYGTAGAVFGVGVLYLLLRGGSSSSASSDAADVQAQASLEAASMQQSTQLQLAQLSATSQNNQIQAQSAVAQGQTNAQVSIAQIQGNTSVSNTNTVAGQNVDIAALNAQTQQLASTLSAQVSDTQTQALEQIALAPYQIQLAQINANAGASAATLTALEGDVNTLIYGTTVAVNSAASANNTNYGGIQTALQSATNNANFTGANLAPLVTFPVASK